MKWNTAINILISHTFSIIHVKRKQSKQIFLDVILTRISTTFLYNKKGEATRAANTHTETMKYLEHSMV